MLLPGRSGICHCLTFRDFNKPTIFGKSEFYRLCETMQRMPRCRIAQVLHRFQNKEKCPVCMLRRSLLTLSPTPGLPHLCLLSSFRKMQVLRTCSRRHSLQSALVNLGFGCQSRTCSFPLLCTPLSSDRRRLVKKKSFFQCFLSGCPAQTEETREGATGRRHSDSCPSTDHTLAQERNAAVFSPGNQCESL